MPSREAMNLFSARTSGIDASCDPANASSDSSRTRHWTSAASPAFCSTRVWASMIRISIVPKRGCRRTSHHTNVGSGKALRRSIASIVST